MLRQLPKGAGLMVGTKTSYVEGLHITEQAIDNVGRRQLGGHLNGPERGSLGDIRNAALHVQRRPRAEHEANRCGQPQ